MSIAPVLQFELKVGEGKQTLSLSIIPHFIHQTNFNLPDNLIPTMPRLPITTLSRFARTSTPSRSALAQRYASTEQQPGKTVEGASGKSQQKAQPKIYSESPPKNNEASEEVQKHNREMDARAERPAERVKEEDYEKDKVGKGFWSGKLESFVRCSVFNRLGLLTITFRFEQSWGRDWVMTGPILDELSFWDKAMAFWKFKVEIPMIL